MSGAAVCAAGVGSGGPVSLDRRGARGVPGSSRSGMPRSGSGELAFVLRLVFAVAMAGSLVLGVAAIRSGNVAGHRAWMIRAYAIAVSAGTQVITLAVAPLFGSGTLNYDLGLGAGWFVNLVVAQLILRHQSAPSRTPSPRITG